MTYRIEDEQQLLPDFAVILRKEVVLYNDLEKVLKTKQRQIIEGNVEQLQDAIHWEHSVIQKIRRATHNREIKAEMISDCFKLGSQNPPLREIIKVAPEQTRGTLIHLQKTLKHTLKNIEYFNSENDYLLNSSVETVRGLIQILLSVGGGDEVLYTGQGAVANPNESRATVDCQV